MICGKCRAEIKSVLDKADEIWRGWYILNYLKKELLNEEIPEETERELEAMMKKK